VVPGDPSTVGRYVAASAAGSAACSIAAPVFGRSNFVVAQIKEFNSDKK
jgi:hypothetical protein